MISEHEEPPGSCSAGNVTTRDGMYDTSPDHSNLPRPFVGENLDEIPVSKGSPQSQSPSKTPKAELLVGDLVWAKIPGHAWWPSMVSYEPNKAVYFQSSGRGKTCLRYHVQFFGDEPQRGWVSDKNTIRFKGRDEFIALPSNVVSKRDKIPQSKQLGVWERALEQAEKALPLNRQQRKLCYVFKYSDDLVRSKSPKGCKSPESPNRKKDKTPKKITKEKSRLTRRSCLLDDVKGGGDLVSEGNIDASNAKGPSMNGCNASAVSQHDQLQKQSDSLSSTRTDPPDKQPGRKRRGKSVAMPLVNESCLSRISAIGHLNFDAKDSPSNSSRAINCSIDDKQQIELAEVPSPEEDKAIITKVPKFKMTKLTGKCAKDCAKKRRLEPEKEELIRQAKKIKLEIVERKPHVFEIVPKKILKNKQTQTPERKTVKMKVGKKRHGKKDSGSRRTLKTKETSASKKFARMLKMPAGRVKGVRKPDRKFKQPKVKAKSTSKLIANSTADLTKTVVKPRKGDINRFGKKKESVSKVNATFTESSYKRKAHTESEKSIPAQKKTVKLSKAAERSGKRTLHNDNGKGLVKGAKGKSRAKGVVSKSVTIERDGGAKDAAGFTNKKSRKKSALQEKDTNYETANIRKKAVPEKKKRIGRPPKKDKGKTIENECFNDDGNKEKRSKKSSSKSLDAPLRNLRGRGILEDMAAWAQVRGQRRFKSSPLNSGSITESRRSSRVYAPLEEKSNELIVCNVAPCPEIDDIWSQNASRRSRKRKRVNGVVKKQMLIDLLTNTELEIPIELQTTASQKRNSLPSSVDAVTVVSITGQSEDAALSLSDSIPPNSNCEAKSCEIDRNVDETKAFGANHATSEDFPVSTEPVKDGKGLVLEEGDLTEKFANSRVEVDNLVPRETDLHDVPGTKESLVSGEASEEQDLPLDSLNHGTIALQSLTCASIVGVGSTVATYSLASGLYHTNGAHINYHHVDEGTDQHLAFEPQNYDDHVNNRFVETDIFLNDDDVGLPVSQASKDTMHSLDVLSSQSETECKSMNDDRSLVGGELRGLTAVHDFEDDFEKQSLEGRNVFDNFQDALRGPTSALNSAITNTECFYSQMLANSCSGMSTVRNSITLERASQSSCSSVLSSEGDAGYNLCPPLTYFDAGDKNLTSGTPYARESAINCVPTAETLPSSRGLDRHKVVETGQGESGCKDGNFNGIASHEESSPIEESKQTVASFLPSEHMECIENNASRDNPISTSCDGQTKTNVAFCSDSHPGTVNDTHTSYVYQQTFDVHTMPERHANDAIDTIPLVLPRKFVSSEMEPSFSQTQEANIDEVAGESGPYESIKGPEQTRPGMLQLRNDFNETGNLHVSERREEMSTPFSGPKQELKSDNDSCLKLSERLTETLRASDSGENYENLDTGDANIDNGGRDTHSRDSSCSGLQSPPRLKSPELLSDDSGRNSDDTKLALGASKRQRKRKPMSDFHVGLAFDEILSNRNRSSDNEKNSSKLSLSKKKRDGSKKIEFEELTIGSKGIATGTPEKEQRCGKEGGNLEKGKKSHKRPKGIGSSPKSGDSKRKSTGTLIIESKDVVVANTGKEPDLADCDIPDGRIDHAGVSEFINGIDTKADIETAGLDSRVAKISSTCVNAEEIKSITIKKKKSPKKARKSKNDDIEQQGETDAECERKHDANEKEEEQEKSQETKIKKGSKKIDETAQENENEWVITSEECVSSKPKSHKKSKKDDVVLKEKAPKTVRKKSVGKKQEALETDGLQKSSTTLDRETNLVDQQLSSKNRKVANRSKVKNNRRKSSNKESVLITSETSYQSEDFEIVEKMHETTSEIETGNEDTSSPKKTSKKKVDKSKDKDEPKAKRKYQKKKSLNAKAVVQNTDLESPATESGKESVAGKVGGAERKKTNKKRKRNDNADDDLPESTQSDSSVMAPPSKKKKVVRKSDDQENKTKKMRQGRKSLASQSEKTKVKSTKESAGSSTDTVAESPTQVTNIKPKRKYTKKGKKTSLLNTTESSVTDSSVCAVDDCENKQLCEKVDLDLSESSDSFSQINASSDAKKRKKSEKFETRSNISDETSSISGREGEDGSKSKKDTICVICEQGEGLMTCNGVCFSSFHPDCLGLSTAPEKFFCDECQTGNHSCFLCKETGTLRKCSSGSCGKFYHDDCIRKLGGCKFDNNKLICSLHSCGTCSNDKENSNVSKKRLLRCVRCPTAYHTTSCLVAGCMQLTSTQMVCNKHFVARKNKPHHSHYNVSWCFVCSTGGMLVCCDTCPAAFHPGCVEDLDGVPDEAWQCDSCREGRKPLYGDLVWVKYGFWRWWPARICFPDEIPIRIQQLHHDVGEFPVMFFGSRDYCWLHAGRVFPYQEGDKGCKGSRTSGTHKIFEKAIKEVEEAYKELKELKDKQLEMRLAKQSKKPPPFKYIKANKYISAVRNIIDQSELTHCECSPSSEYPCGSGSECLNRMLQIECDKTCPAGDKCLNQRFQKCQQVDCAPYRTSRCGWGLKTRQDIKKGEFVIEYVGELIDEATCRKRINDYHDKGISDYYFLVIDKDNIIDAYPKGNQSRFMNHSCDPNCDTQKWTVNGEIRVGLFANRDIEAGSDLVFNYNLDTLGNEKKACQCGSKNCSGFLGVRPKTQVALALKEKKKEKQKKKKKKDKTQMIRHEDDCFVCGDGGELIMCDRTNCSKCYHLKCLTLSEMPRGKWDCPWHFCDVCGKRAAFFCSICPNSFCGPHHEGEIFEISKGVNICEEHAAEEIRAEKHRLMLLNKEAESSRQSTSQQAASGESQVEISEHLKEQIVEG